MARPKLDTFRKASPAVRAPSVGTAWAVWELVCTRLATVPLPSGDRPRRIEDVASSILSATGANGTERTEITVAALQALTVAIDVMVAPREPNLRSAYAMRDAFWIPGATP